MRRAGLFALLLLMPAMAAAPARAGGGAHIVDNATVETPGVCHLETWVADYEPGYGYFNASPACTFKALPRLQIGVNYQHIWDDPTATLLGPAVKLNLRPEETGTAIAVSFNAGVHLGTGDLDLATILVPVTVPIGDKVELNFNAGWSYVRDDQHQNAVFYGAQAMANVGLDTALMIEVFGRAPGIGGAQMGLRFTPGAGPIDFELLAGGFFDQVSPRFFTFGVTVRY